VSVVETSGHENKMRCVHSGWRTGSPVGKTKQGIAVNSQLLIFELARVGQEERTNLSGDWNEWMSRSSGDFTESIGLVAKLARFMRTRSDKSHREGNDAQ
jgi:hypothetical protein